METAIVSNANNSILNRNRSCHPLRFACIHKTDHRNSIWSTDRHGLTSRSHHIISLGKDAIIESIRPKYCSR